MPSPEEQKKAIEKAERKQRQAVLGLTNRLKMQFSFGTIKTWRDCYKFTGYDDAYIATNFTPEQCSKPIDFSELKVWCAKLLTDLDVVLKERKYETENKSNVPASIPTPSTDKIQLQPVSSVSEKGTTIGVQTSAHFQPAQSVSPQVDDESGFNNSNDYGLWPSTKEKAFLFWFQKRATKEALDKIL